MVRFAVTMALVEIALTIGAAFAITLVEPGEPYLSEADLRGLRIPFESVRTSRTKRFDSQVFYDTRVQLLGPPQTLYVSVRTESSAVDFEHRLNRERQRQRDPKQGAIALLEEPMPGEQGYTLRHRGPSSVRSELVRFRGTDLFIVSVGRSRPFDSTPDQEVVRCERRARTVELYLLEKLGWRN